MSELPSIYDGLVLSEQFRSDHLKIVENSKMSNRNDRLVKSKLFMWGHPAWPKPCTNISDVYPETIKVLDPHFCKVMAKTAQCTYCCVGTVPPPLHLVNDNPLADNEKIYN